MASEAWVYRQETVQDRQGRTVDVARFRRRRGGSGEFEFRGTGPGRNAPGRVRRNIQTTAARSAARNPALRNNRYGV